MDKRKTAPVWGLFYRETAPICKDLVLCYVFAIVLGIIFYLIKLSMEIGNLADMPEDKLLLLKQLLPMYALYLPGLLFMAPASGMTSSFQFEMSKVWRCYIASTPVSEWKYVCIKFVVSSGALFTGTIFTFINAAVICSVYDVAFDRSVAANLLLCVALVSLMCAVLYILNFLLRNSNTAVLTWVALLFTALLVVIINNISFIEEASEDDAEGVKMIMEKINDFSTAFMPFAIPCIIVSLVLGWVICSLLAKRREK